MNKPKRIVLQVLFWALIALMMWYFQRTRNNAIFESASLFILQTVCVLITARFLTSRFLFKKKHLEFSLFSLLLAAICTLIIFSLLHEPRPIIGGLGDVGGIGGPRGVGGLGGPPKGPPRTRPQSPVFIYFLLLSFAIVVTTIIESMFFAFEKEKESIRNKNEHTSTELKLLRSQINPHFLFNALNNIYSLSLLNSERTPDSIFHLSEMLRYVLYDCEREIVSLDKEVQYIKNYIQLFQLKSSKEFNISTDVSIEGEQNIAPMLLIPFVENAFKHSSIEQDTDGFIEIHLKSNLEGIIFSVKNSILKRRIIKDGVGGIGLKNVQKRLDLLYPENHNLKLGHSEDSFNVYLHLKIDSIDD